MNKHGEIWKAKAYWNVTCTNFNKCFGIEIKNMPKKQFINYLKQHGWHNKNNQWYCKDC